MRFIVISDTHGDHRQLKLPAGDFLIHCGDMTAEGRLEELMDFADWFDEQDYSNKVMIAGNHDRALESAFIQFEEKFRNSSFSYLNNQKIELSGIRFWGSPITPRFYDWAFMKDPGPQMKQHWEKMPISIDVLITHGPPFGIMDVVSRKSGENVNAGCPELLEKVKSVAPGYHLFGHIHEGYGQLSKDGINYVNACSMDANYRMQNLPIVFDFSPANR